MKSLLFLGKQELKSEDRDLVLERFGGAGILLIWIKCAYGSALWISKCNNCLQKQMLWGENSELHNLPCHIKPACSIFRPIIRPESTMSRYILSDLTILSADISLFDFYILCITVSHALNRYPPFVCLASNIKTYVLWSVYTQSYNKYLFTTNVVFW